MARSTIKTLTRDDFDLLLSEWAMALRAAGRSPQTVKTYTAGVKSYLRFVDANDVMPDLSRSQVRGFIASLIDHGAAASTQVARHHAVTRFSAWLAEEQEIDADALVGLKPPTLDQKVVEPLTDDQLRALIKACKGSTMRDRRDEALVRLMFETGMRAGEAAVLALADVDTATGRAVVRRGKGGKGRSVSVRPSDGRQHQPVQEAAQTPPTRCHRCAVAGRPGQAVLIRRAPQDAEGTGRHGGR